MQLLQDQTSYTLQPHDPLMAKEYLSYDPRDAVFGALPYTKTAGPDASLALPAYKGEQLTTAL